MTTPHKLLFTSKFSFHFGPSSAAPLVPASARPPRRPPSCRAARGPLRPHTHRRFRGALCGRWGAELRSAHRLRAGQRPPRKQLCSPNPGPSPPETGSLGPRASHNWPEVQHRASHPQSRSLGQGARPGAYLSHLLQPEERACPLGEALAPPRPCQPWALRLWRKTGWRPSNPASEQGPHVTVGLGTASGVQGV